MKHVAGQYYYLLDLTMHKLRKLWVQMYYAEWFNSFV